MRKILLFVICLLTACTPASPTATESPASTDEPVPPITLTPTNTPSPPSANSADLPAFNYVVDLNSSLTYPGETLGAGGISFLDGCLAITKTWNFQVNLYGQIAEKSGSFVTKDLPIAIVPITFDKENNVTYWFDFPLVTGKFFAENPPRAIDFDLDQITDTTITHTTNFSYNINREDVYHEPGRALFYAIWELDDKNNYLGNGQIGPICSVGKEFTVIPTPPGGGGPLLPGQTPPPQPTEQEEG